ncbi:MAG: lipid A 3-O-deacylase [Candidatus Krumholzibacteriia bacterium]|jgi:lipid A 3-O-deacylase
MRLPAQLILWFVVASIAIGANATSARGENAANESPGFFIFHFENDVLGTDDSDLGYTNGLQFSYLTGNNQVWPWLDGWARKHLFKRQNLSLRAYFALGQNLYTPEDLSRSEIILDDRPYAAWLHADLGLVGHDDHMLRSLQFSIGVVGPAAQGEPVQSWIHQVIESPDPKGWGNQIGNELALLVVADQKWRNIVSLDGLPLLGSLGLQADFSPHVGAAIGNVMSAASVGGTIRFGKGLEQDFGPPRIHPAPPGSGYFADESKVAWYLFLGVDGRAVLNNIFLDGNTFRNSHRVEKNTLVGDYLGGFAVSALGMRVGLVYVNRTKEFELQDRASHFGSITISFRL